CVVNGEHLSPCLQRAAEGPRDDPRPPRFRCTRAVSVQTACYAARVVGGSAGRGGIPPVPRPRVRRRTASASSAGGGTDRMAGNRFPSNAQHRRTRCPGVGRGKRQRGGSAGGGGLESRV